MKKILITGINSYIGNSVEKWLLKEPNKYEITKISVRNDSWHIEDFSKFDVIFHVAAIVHKYEKSEMQDLYFNVNRDLPVDVANKAKREGVKQFIFMSSMAIYGEEGKIGKEVVITKETKSNPKSYYGKSKIEAENKLKLLADNNFKIVVLRPPMVYGPNCPGNYARLEKLSNITPIFPLIDNKRSILHVDNLCKYVKKYIDDEVEGIFFPQDANYANISLFVKEIAKKNGKKIYLSRVVGWVIILIGKRVHLINKVFGTLIYERED